MAPAAPAQSLLSSLAVERPEWRPLLALIADTLGEIGRPQWTRCAPVRGHHGRDGRPLLDGAIITLAPGLIERWVRRVLMRAADSGTDVKSLAGARRAGRLSSRFLFETAMSQNTERLDELVAVTGDGRGVLRALAPLIAMPMLHACRTAWADDIPMDWPYGYCPICGGWPALAERRGLDGTRHLRCAACGSGWRIQWLRCPFCGADDHRKLGALISTDTLEPQTIDVCDECHRYVKSVTTLTSLRPEEVVLHDLATLVLDVAAIERDYSRPAAGTNAVELTVVAETARRRDLFGLLS